ncbi:DNA topoisomerase [Ornithobacterium rhinotracheale]|uniref:DNA topoisomerase n=1 Tax=Ornithobacterium rhinotracheale TaxID=28251 RepID=UPI001FB99EA6|nr:DNA topoisomerase [Ornithobacterium rhinotracheale]UOH77047.1 DNA topoisomerase [Ornithobacterium rhinotracheale]
MPLYTEVTLLSAMESAGKDLEDENQRQLLKGTGIGTPATRAATIETLLKRNYIKRQKKSLVPTEKGVKSV